MEMWRHLCVGQNEKEERERRGAYQREGDERAPVEDIPEDDRSVGVARGENHGAWSSSNSTRTVRGRLQPPKVEAVDRALVPAKHKQRFRHRRRRCCGHALDPHHLLGLFLVRNVTVGGCSGRTVRRKLTCGA